MCPKNSLRSKTARLQQTAKTAERRQLDDASAPSGACMTNFWVCWAEAPLKIARMTLTIKLDGNWSSFQLANNTPPLSVTGSVIAPSARIEPTTMGRRLVEAGLGSPWLSCGHGINS